MVFLNRKSLDFWLRIQSNSSEGKDLHSCTNNSPYTDWALLQRDESSCSLSNLIMKGGVSNSSHDLNCPGCSKIQFLKEVHTKGFCTLVNAVKNCENTIFSSLLYSNQRKRLWPGTWSQIAAGDPWDVKGFSGSAATFLFSFLYTSPKYKTKALQQMIWNRENDIWMASSWK